MSERSDSNPSREDWLHQFLGRLIEEASLAACGEKSALFKLEEQAAGDAGPFAEELVALAGIIRELATGMSTLRERAGMPPAASWRETKARPVARFRGGPSASAPPSDPQLALQRVRDDLIQKVGLAPAAIILFGSSRKAQVSTAAIDRDGYGRLVDTLASDEKLLEGIRKTQPPSAEQDVARNELGAMLSTWRKYLA